MNQVLITLAMCLTVATTLLVIAVCTMHGIIKLVRSEAAKAKAMAASLEQQAVLLKNQIVQQADQIAHLTNKRNMLAALLAEGDRRFAQPVANDHKEHFATHKTT